MQMKALSLLIFHMLKKLFINIIYISCFCQKMVFKADNRRKQYQVYLNDNDYVNIKCLSFLLSYKKVHNQNL